MKKKLPKIRQTKAKFNSGFQKFKNGLAGISMLAFAFILTTAVEGQTWSDPPEGYTRVFFEDFSEPYTGDNSWQGVDNNKWEIPSANGEPDESGRSVDKHPTFSSNVMVKDGGGLYTYGGRRPDREGGNTISDDERAAGYFKSRDHVVKPGYSGPRIVRIRMEWEQIGAYLLAPWSFSSWAEVTVNGVTFEQGWEHDLETRGSEYDANARTFKPHFNNHVWNRPIDYRGAQSSQQSPLSKDVKLPDDPRGLTTIELRWRRGADFWDPYQTYVEWWVEEVVDGEATGNMIRRYHWSPRHLLEEKRNNDNWIKPDDPPPAEPLPPELAEVAPSKVWAGKNRLKDTPPYDKLGDRLFQPYIAAYDESYTWWDVVRDSWSDEGAGQLSFDNGFKRGWYFLSPEGPLYVSDYEGHHSHVDDHHCISSVIWGVAVFDPDE